MFERNPDKSIDVTADGAVALVDDFATAGEQEEISTPPMSDKRGYVKSSAGVGDAEPLHDGRDGDDLPFLSLLRQSDGYDSTMLQKVKENAAIIPFPRLLH